MRSHWKSIDIFEPCSFLMYGKMTMVSDFSDSGIRAFNCTVLSTQGFVVMPLTSHSSPPTLAKKHRELIRPAFVITTHTCSISDLPILIHHHNTQAENDAREQSTNTRVGSVGFFHYMNDSYANWHFVQMGSFRR
jgi:hypothetical protein